MTGEERLRMDVLEVIAKQQPEYQALLADMREIEAKYNEVLRKLSSEDQTRSAISFPNAGKSVGICWNWPADL